ncbi:hypothetical protein MC378_14280 [Polaribacter sp. MSW13]|uniref:Uncharacterized protein n=1 Tax=Polaribacter marinus TaxID=2916838 RepID=A0A9X1VQE7_9FLAO|nr:hypothetical protein [Polaribacter marinus]MCI2230343.1 hypothetical protein [Polaribacter marinus]
MKIEKYNQRILAVLGTVGVIFLIVALIAFISITIMEHRSYDDVETGILSDEKIEELQKENKREQVISYENPRLIDTLNSVYIIPVSHKTLNDQEDINGLLNLTKASSSYEKNDTRYSRQYYGAFNNLIVYDSKNDSNKKLFDKRVNFNQIKAEYFEDDILLLMRVSEKDTYKDGVINLLDFKTLYIYSLGKKELKKVGIEGMDIFNFKFLNNEKDLTILFGVDKNSDGKFEEYNEPTLIKKYEFETGKMTDIVDEKINIDLQETLEGTKK